MNLLERAERTSFYSRMREGVNEGLARYFRSHLERLGKELIAAELASGSAYGAECLAREECVKLSVALDNNQALYRGSRERIKTAVFIVGDLTHPPFKDESFDFTWSSSSVEHFDDPAAAVQSMSRLTKPGGLVFIGVPYLAGPLALYYLTPLSSWRRWLGKPFSRGKLERVVRAAGLKPIAWRVYFMRCFIGVIASK